MSKYEKIAELHRIVEESFCSMEWFAENVANSSGGAKEFTAKFKKANCYDDLVNLVNEYI